MPTHLKPSEPLGDNDTAKYSMVPAYSPSNSVAGHISPADFDFPESEFHSPLPGSSGGSREITIGTEPDTITCPEFIGEYRVIGLIGRGGMGNVLRVKNPFFDFEQALKMIVTRLDSRSAREQFIMEMKTQAELEHAHIAKVHYAGIHGGKGKYRGQLYFVMSLEAGDLGEAIKKNGPCDPSEAAKIVRQLAQAIGLAHSRGKFHCDLKPKNILLGVDGTPKVTDFGLVKLLTETQKAGAAQGEPFGTPSYMPPEQAEGDLTRVDARSDVYGLGAILYELLTGGPPFKTGNRTEILYQVKNVDPQPIRKTQPRAPARLEAICLKCLEKDPAKRYQSAAELEKVLEEYLRPHWWVRHGKKAAVAGVMGALVAAIVWLWHTHYYTPHQEDKSEIAGAMGLNSRAESESSIPEKKLLYVEALDKFKKHAHQEHLYPDIRKDIVRIESRLGLIGAALMEKSAEESRRYGKRDTAIGQFKIAIQNYRVCLNEQSEDAGKVASLGLAKSYTTLAELQIENREYTDAEDSLNDADKTIAEAPIELDFKLAKAEVHHVRGMCRSEMGQSPEALASFKLGRDCRIACREFAGLPVDFERGLALSHGYLGDEEMKAGQFDAASKSYSEAQKIRSDLAKLGGDVEKCFHARDHGNFAELNEWKGADTALAIRHRAQRVEYYRSDLGHLPILPGTHRCARAASELDLVELLLDEPDATVQLKRIDDHLRLAELEYSEIRKRTGFGSSSPGAIDVQLLAGEARTHLIRARYFMVLTKSTSLPVRALQDADSQLKSADDYFRKLSLAGRSQPEDYYNWAAVYALRTQLTVEESERLKYSIMALDRLGLAIEKGYLKRERLKRDFAFSGLKKDRVMGPQLQKLIDSLPDPDAKKPEAVK